MEKRYQVFISSTFQDLQNARQEVSQALLRADCFPAGMELFPAADEEQFAFIKTVIDQSDYYIIISAGRYGSIHPETGLSYTEMEYDYAVEIEKPIIRLLHKSPTEIATGSDAEKGKLFAFRERLKTGRMVSFWETPDQLGKETVFALMELRKTKRAVGWVKADGRASEEAELEVLRLREELREVRRGKPDTLEARLNFEAPVTEALVSSLQILGSVEPAVYVANLLTEVETAVDRDDIRDSRSMIDWLRFPDEDMSDGKEPYIDQSVARQVIDALIIDRLLSISGVSSRLTISPTGRMAIAKARLASTIGNYAGSPK